MHRILRACSFTTIVLALTACMSAPRASRIAPPDEFFQELSALCGKAYAGRVVVDTPKPANDAFAGKPLVMHVRDCSEDAIRIPFHVGDDRSRTWVITRMTSGPATTGLRLKHDHRHRDGSEDAVTQYGGDTIDAGTRQRQAFPADAHSKAMFVREKLPASIDNTWAIELVAARSFTYELSRPSGRLFRVEFDLGQPVAAPPAPWGAGQ